MRGRFEHLKIPRRNKADGRLYVECSGRIRLKAIACGDVSLVGQPEDAQRRADRGGQTMEAITIITFAIGQCAAWTSASISHSHARYQSGRKCEERLRINIKSKRPLHLSPEWQALQLPEGRRKSLVAVFHRQGAQAIGLSRVVTPAVLEQSIGVDTNKKTASQGCRKAKTTTVKAS